MMPDGGDCCEAFSKLRDEWHKAVSQIKQLTAGIATFADDQNWYASDGFLTWAGKRNAIEYAQSLLPTRSYFRSTADED